MKKLWSGFCFIIFCIAAAAAGGVFLTVTGAVVPGIILIFAALTAAVWFYMYFRRLNYYLRDKDFIIESGVFFRKVKRIKYDRILWINIVSAGRIPLFAVLHTGGGSIILFARLDDPERFLYSGKY